MTKKLVLFTSVILLCFSSIVSAKCDATADFVTPPKTKRQSLDLAEGVTLKLAQTISTQIKSNAKIASNVICQVLEGASYTGSEEEWQGFINSAANGLIAKEYQNVTLTLVGEMDATYKGKKQNKEYVFTAKTPSGVQHIHNLAVLDKENNTFYTLSVSGDESIKDEVIKEYKRLVDSFSL
ncbi:PsbP-related protein [Pseudoalteromonas sp.]|uniref:PsbP-related protein n=1 Tax=Pseudoalteromonas sp. TaxID=53249 RepID=UPI0035619EF9